jgi:hypothetical protein
MPRTDRRLHQSIAERQLAHTLMEQHLCRVAPAYNSKIAKRKPFACGLQNGFPLIAGSWQMHPPASYLCLHMCSAWTHNPGIHVAMRSRNGLSVTSSSVICDRYTDGWFVQDRVPASYAYEIFLAMMGVCWASFKV